MAKRFAHLTDAEVDEKRLKLTAENTKRSNLTAANAFRDYLREKDLNTTFEDFAPDVLDKNLGQFYMEARRANGQLYQGSSLH
ncbi:hypothetical protein V1264_024601 [Littorina saxatilis]|uniref:Uncharacterized protein n=1 Tax=Littorina saxatilis TaxID=31220 RepID=A0AAN9ALT4_9CAEN